MDIICLIRQLIWCLNFCHMLSFFICGRYTYVVSAFVVYVFHTSRNGQEFFLLSLRSSFLNIPYCFGVSNLADSELFLLPKLTYIPTKFLLFLPLVSRYVHQQHYCVSYLYQERFNIIFLFLPKYYQSYSHSTPFSTTFIIRFTHITPLLHFPYCCAVQGNSKFHFYEHDSTK
jgi:hypothetical protein